MLHFFKTVAVGILLVALSNCAELAQPSYNIAFYTVEYAPPKITDLRPLPLNLRIDDFATAPPYNSRHMIYSEKPFKREVYHYYQWQATPGEMTGFCLTRDLQQSGLFKAVLPSSSPAPGAYLVSGNVDEFLEKDEGQNWQAVLTLNIVVHAETWTDISKAILLQKTYSASEACKFKSPQALAEAMSRAMAQVSREILQDLHQALLNTMR